MSLPLCNYLIEWYLVPSISLATTIPNVIYSLSKIYIGIVQTSVCQSQTHLFNQTQVKLNLMSIMYNQTAQTHCKIDLGLNPWVGTFLCGVRRYSGFPPPSNDMFVRLTVDSKLPIGVNMSVNGCLSLYASHLRDW